MCALSDNLPVDSVPLMIGVADDDRFRKYK